VAGHGSGLLRRPPLSSHRAHPPRWKRARRVPARRLGRPREPRPARSATATTSQRKPARSSWWSVLHLLLFLW